MSIALEKLTNLWKYEFLNLMWYDSLLELYRMFINSLLDKYEILDLGYMLSVISLQRKG